MSLDVLTCHADTVHYRTLPDLNAIPIYGSALQFMASHVYNGNIGGPYSVNAPNRKYIGQGNFFCTSQHADESCSVSVALNQMEVSLAAQYNYGRLQCPKGS